MKDELETYAFQLSVIAKNAPDFTVFDLDALDRIIEGLIRIRKQHNWWRTDNTNWVRFRFDPYGGGQ